MTNNNTFFSKILSTDNSNSSNNNNISSPFSEEIDENGLPNLLVPIEFRTPLCFSLRHLILSKHKYHGTPPKLCNSAIAFVLRHFPFLLRLDVSTGEAIKTHHNTRVLVENTHLMLGNIERKLRFRSSLVHTAFLVFKILYKYFQLIIHRISFADQLARS